MFLIYILKKIYVTIFFRTMRKILFLFLLLFVFPSTVMAEDISNANTSNIIEGEVIELEPQKDLLENIIEEQEKRRI